MCVCILLLVLFLCIKFITSPFHHIVHKYVCVISLTEVEENRGRTWSNSDADFVLSQWYRLTYM